MADHRVAFVLQTLLTMIQILPFSTLFVCCLMSYSLLLVYFVAGVQRHLQARDMDYSVSSGFEWFRLDGHITRADSVWMEDFFEIDFGSKSVLSPCGLR